LSASTGKGSHARRHAAFDLALGLREGLAQFVQRLAADQRRQKQAVRLQRAADLDQRARQVIHKLQRQRRDHEIERAFGERQGFLVGGDTAGGNGRADFATFGEHARHRVARRAEIGGALELAQHDGEPFAQLVRHAVDQECRRPERPRARQASAQKLAVENGWARRHLATLSRPTPSCVTLAA
jgi:hypothetical protein